MGLRASAIEAYLGEGMVGLRRGWHRLARRGRRRLRFFHQVDDPYSHLLLQMLPKLVGAVPLSLETIVVPPPQEDHDLRAAYSLKDATELAARHGLVFEHGGELPDPDSVARANAVLLRGAVDLGRAADVGAALWRGDAIDDVDTSSVAAQLADNMGVLERAGHYQGGMLKYEGEWYWGPDRLHYLEARLRDEGLEVAPCLPEATPAEPTSADVLEMFYSFRSPYSYIAIDRVRAMCGKHDVALQLRPVLPMVMRGLKVPLRKRLYIARDVAREARRLGVPFGKLCDPLGIGIEHCMAIFGYAEREGKAAAFASSVGRGAWAEALDIANEEDLATLVRRAGLDWAVAKKRLGDYGWKAMADDNRELLLSLGMWGVPSFRFGDYVIWGNDRLDRLEERMAEQA